MTDIRLAVADIIRKIDPDGTVDVSTLGAALGLHLAPHFADFYAADVREFVVNTFTGDVTSAVDLADAVVRHFHLGQEI